MRRILLAFWLAAICATGPALAGAPPSAPEKAAPSVREKDERFERWAKSIAAGDDIVGLALAVVREGEPTLIRTYGPREMGGSEAVNRHTVFRVASLSKGFSAGLVAQLVAEGKLELTSRAKEYSPDFRLKDPRQLGKVTVESIMSHRLGLPHNAYDHLLESNVPPARILRRLGKVRPICEVNDCYAYQNVAFNVIADVIEAVDGRSVGEAMAARLFKPLGMETASVGMDGLRSTGNWARPHRRWKGRPWRVASVRQRYYRLPAAAGVNASITDMARWLAAQMGSAPEVLSPEMLSMMHEPRVETPEQFQRIQPFLNVASAHYGLGWRIYQYQGEKVVSHTGSVDGYSTQIAFLPDRKTGIVALCNSRSGAFYWIVPIWLNIELDSESGPR